MTEQIITTVRAYLTDSSKVVVIPKKIRKMLGEKTTDLFIVKLDHQNRIILEPVIKPKSALDEFIRAGAHPRQAPTAKEAPKNEY